MPDVTPDAATDREHRLDAILAAYLEAIATGTPPDRQALLDQHPDLAEALRAFFADYDRVHRLAQPLHAVAQAARGRAPTEPAGESAPGETLVGTQATLPPGPDLTTDFSPEHPPEDSGTDLRRGARVHYFGDYELSRILGRGGMGVVYKARQVSLNRPVALKMIRAGLWAGEDEVRRFKNEAEAIANLDHPQIVTIHEVGEHSGRHYFSMKLVEGPRLSDRLEWYASRPREAANLVAEVARAVHHAHQRGILHRDLKPSNILLDREDRPHVTDFGLAKRIEGNGSLSVSGAIVGTPQYMSPEQASGTKHGITTATDVYGLGALLYASLTGQPPFQSDSVVSTLQQVQEKAVEPPSRINPRVGRDLETICLKCLEKDARRRYRSADALADDLERYLRGEPILARRTGPVERAAKWARRRPAIAALVGAVFLTAFCGFAGVTVQWRRAENQRERAERNADLARGAVEDYLTTVSQNTLLNSGLPGLQPLRKELLEKALRYYQEFLRQGGDNPAQRSAAAAAYYRVGDITGEIGAKLAALDALSRARTLYEGLARAHPGEQAYRFGVARCYRRSADLQNSIGPPEQAAEFYKQAVSIGESLRRDHRENPAFLAELALAYRGAGLLRPAIDVGETLVHKHPAVPEYRDDLARCYFSLGIEYEFAGRLDEALNYAERARTIRETLVNENKANPYFQSGLAGSLANLSRLHEYSGHPEEALRLYERCFDIIAKAARENPEVKPFQLRLAMSYPVRAHLLSDNGRTHDALEPARQAVIMMEPVAREHPADWQAQLFLAWGHIEMGKVLLGEGQTNDAIKSFVHARAIVEKPPKLTDPFLLNMTFFIQARIQALHSSAVGRDKTRLTEAEEAERRLHAEEAMKALEQTAAGFTYPGMLKYEHEFDVLRPRGDFQVLVRALEERVKSLR